MEEKPDVLGPQGAEAEDAAKGTAVKSGSGWDWDWGWTGTERRSQRSRRWYDTMSLPERESRTVEEKPDISGTQGSEAEDTAKGTAVESGPDGPERRWLRSKRWYEKMSLAEFEARIREMVQPKDRG